jgi:3-hydroxyisobutyrate dehydrogenase-like beta-hydroxyacid dehydrogenase
MKIAFLGIGNMGSGMVRNLLRAGHQVVAYNRSRAKAEELVKDGATVAGSISEACDGAEAAWTMLADDAALRAVVFGDGGVLESLPKGAIHLSSSTVTVAISKELAQQHEKAGQRYLAVPVFGRPDAAEAKKLIVVAGGRSEWIDEVRPVLEEVGRALYVAGSEPWQANLFKLCGNFTLVSMMETLGEAFAVVRKAGADHKVLFEILATLYGSPVYQNYGSAIVEERFEPAGFPLKLGLKDVRQMLEAAGELEAPMPVASVVRDQLISALAHGQEKQDWSSVSRTAARNAGVS